MPWLGVILLGVTASLEQDPKAGGPNYLRQLVVEHTVTDNVTALGGNTELFNLE